MTSVYWIDWQIETGPVWSRFTVHHCMKLRLKRKKISHAFHKLHYSCNTEVTIGTIVVIQGHAPTALWVIITMCFSLHEHSWLENSTKWSKKATH